MKVRVNDRDKILPENMNLEKLLEMLSYKDKSSLAIAVNETIVKKELWTDTVLKEGDKVIIITATCGG